MKKGLKLLFLSVLTLSVLTGCGKTTELQKETIETIEQAYAVAQKYGYQGTLDEFIILIKGDDGLSAYELYKKYHPEYTKTEAEWVEELFGQQSKCEHVFNPNENLPRYIKRVNDNLVYAYDTECLLCGAKTTKIDLDMPIYQNHYYVDYKIFGESVHTDFVKYDSPSYRMYEYTEKYYEKNGVWYEVLGWDTNLTTVNKDTVVNAKVKKTEATISNLFAISYNLYDPNMSCLWKPGLEEASLANGFAKLDMKDARNDDSEAVKMVEAAAKQNYGAYLINVVDQSNGKSYLNKVKPTNKPLIFWNREVGKDVMTSYDKAYYVGIESAEAGRYQGAMAAEYVNSTGFAKLDRNGDGKLGVIVVRGEKGHADAEARTLYAPMYLERNLTGGNAAADAEVSGTTYTKKGDWNKVDVKAIVDGTDTAGTTWEPVTAANEVARVLNEKGDEIDLVLSNSDNMALGIIKNNKFKEAGIPVWGVDALGDAIAEIKKQNTQFMGTVKNDGTAQANVCVKIARNLVDNKAPGEGLIVVNTKAEWEANKKAIWYDAETKSFRVHHAKITKANA